MIPAIIKVIGEFTFIEEKNPLPASSMYNPTWNHFEENKKSYLTLDPHLKNDDEVDLDDYNLIKQYHHPFFNWLDLKEEEISRETRIIARKKTLIEKDPEIIDHIDSLDDDDYEIPEEPTDWIGESIKLQKEYKRLKDMYLKLLEVHILNLPLQETDMPDMLRDKWLTGAGLK